MVTDGVAVGSTVGDVVVVFPSGVVTGVREGEGVGGVVLGFAETAVAWHWSS